MRSRILSVVILIAVLLSTEVKVHGANAIQVLELFGGRNSSEILDTTELEKQLKEQEVTIRLRLDKYSRERRAELTANIGKTTASLEYDIAYRTLGDYASELTVVHEEMNRAVKAGAPLTALFELEEEYRIVQQKLQEKEEEVELWQMLSAQDVVETSFETYSEIESALTILQELSKEYDKIKSFEDIGELKPRIPITSKRLKFTSFFGMRPHPFTGAPGNNHTGLDIAGSYGDYNLALYSGVVVLSAWSNVGYGNYVVIDHGQGLRTLYAHGVKNLVQVGDTVTQYQKIQETGSTGFSTGPHLHLGVIIDGTFVDPYILWRGRE